MKPSLLTLGLATSLLCAPALVRAQTKSVPPELLAAAPAWSGDHNGWGTIPPPKPLPYGYVWSEYRGADIEHPLYAPRHHGHMHRASCGPTVVSQFCCWFDKLFTRKCATGSSTPCESYVSTELPPLPPLAPLAPAAPQWDNTPPELAPVPVPRPSVIAAPAPRVEREIAPQPSASEAAPVMPPVDLIPTRPLVVNDPPADPAPAEPTPTPLTPAQIEPAPSDPAPHSTGPLATTPLETTPVAPSPPGSTPLPEPRPSASERTPVVELAPDFVVPGVPAPIAPPANAVPTGPQVPHNVIPQRAVPSNVIPNRRGT